MIVFRLSKSRFARSLDGKGAEKYGGRWNSPGMAMIYTCQSRSLCLAEIAVHTATGNIPDDYNLISIEIPGRSISKIKEDALPADWKAVPPSKSTQSIGDHFILNAKTLTLKVPSVIVKEEFNFLINPLHPEMKRVRIVSIEPFEFDIRLFL